NLQQTLAVTNDDLKQLRKTNNDLQNEYNRTQFELDTIEKKFSTDIDERDFQINQLKKKVQEQDNKLNTFYENDAPKETDINRLRTEIISLEHEAKKKVPSAEVTRDISSNLRLEVQRRDDVYN
ncbi:unnamed protein product, partial [Didymodactylos carnosus]